MIEERPNVRFHVLLIDGIDLGRDFELHIRSFGYLDGSIEPFLWGNSPHKCKVATNATFRLIEIQRKAMINRSLPIDSGQGYSLGVRNGNNRHINELTIKREQIRQVQSAMLGSNVGYIDPSRERKMQVIDVEMDDVKGRGFLEDLLELEKMICQPIHTSWIQSKRTLAGRDQTAFGDRVTTREQSNVMTLVDQFFSKIGNNTLGSTVAERRNAFVKWRDLGNSHNSSYFPVSFFLHDGTLNAIRFRKLCTSRGKNCSLKNDLKKVDIEEAFL